MLYESIEGEMEIYEQEGGFFHAVVQIGGQSITGWIIDSVGQSVPIEQDRCENILEEGKQSGRYRLTLRKIE